MTLIYRLLPQSRQHGDDLLVKENVGVTAKHSVSGVCAIGITKSLQFLFHLFLIWDLAFLCVVTFMSQIHHYKYI